MKTRGLLALVLLWTVACGGGAVPPEDAADPRAFEVLPEEVVRTAETLRRRALESGLAYELLASLTTEVGSRFAGTAGDRRAVAWAQRNLSELGFSKVRAEPVTVPRWVRGHAAAEIVSPHPQPLVLVALGGSAGTPAGGLEAEVVEVAGLEELAGLERSQVEGKIVFLNRRMRRTKEGAGYGETVPIRTQGPAKAAALGAVAAVIRSVGTDNNRIGHTGTTRFGDGPRIPAAALSNPDADLLAAQLAGGGPVRLRLDLGCETLDDVTSANVLAEVAGREAAEEIVLLAGHLDSWDVGTGAVDDGAGCVIVAAVARLIGELPTPPRRTVRVLWTANEEFGLSGARAYAEAYRDDLEHHAVAMESDFGAGRVWALRGSVAPERQAVVRDLARLLAPLGIEHDPGPARGGADLGPLRPQRVPFLDLRQDGSLYFDVHHTDNDTLDKVDPEALAQNVAAFAVAAYVAAEVEGGLGRAPEVEEEAGRR